VIQGGRCEGSLTKKLYQGGSRGARHEGNRRVACILRRATRSSPRFAEGSAKARHCTFGYIATSLRRWAHRIRSGQMDLALVLIRLIEPLDFRVEADFPLWGMPTSELAHSMIKSGVRAKVTCVDPSFLAPEFVIGIPDPGRLRFGGIDLRDHVRRLFGRGECQGV
jgi:hypothetical protein